MKKLSILLIALLFMFGCGGGESGKPFVGVSMPTKDLERWSVDGDNLEKQLKNLGYKVSVQYAQNEVSTQVSQIENLITLGANLLIIAPIDGEALTTVLKDAADKNIKVIAYDRLMQGMTLRADVSGLKGSGTIAYKWIQRDSYAIEEANYLNISLEGEGAEYYLLTDEDVGRYITVTVTRSNNGKNSITDELSSITSEVIGPIEPFISFKVEQIGGVNYTADTTGLQLTFTHSVAAFEITLNDISLTEAAEKTGGTVFSTSDSESKVWVLSPITVKIADFALVRINTPGISDLENTVLVYKAGENAPDYVQITWNLNSGTWTSGSAEFTAYREKGILIEEPTPPIKVHHSFGGWYSDANLANEYLFESVVMADLALYARWDINQYTLNFSVEDATSGVAPPSITDVYNTAIPLPGNEGFTRAGYTFGGWNDSLGAHYDAGTSYALASSITLSAQWIPVIHIDLSWDPFAVAEYGFTPLAKPITITNTGTGPVLVSDIALSGNDASTFVLSGFTLLPINIDNTGDTTNIMVQPRLGLSVGSYTAVLTVKYNNAATATLDLTFLVEPLRLIIGPPTGSPTKVYDGTTAYTGSDIILGSVINRVSGDPVYVSITNTAYNSANVANADNISIVYGISGMAAGNSLAPENGLIPAAITKATLSVFPDPGPIVLIYFPGLCLENLSLPDYAWHTPATALTAGPDQIFLAAYTNPDGNYHPKDGPITVHVAKANGLPVPKPTLVSFAATTITVNAITLNNGQLVEYAVSESSTEPVNLTWIGNTTLDITALTAPYYVYARSVSNTNYNTGTAARSDAIDLQSITLTIHEIMDAGITWNADNPLILSRTAGNRVGIAVSMSNDYAIEWYYDDTRLFTGVSGSNGGFLTLTVNQTDVNYNVKYNILGQHYITLIARKLNEVPSSTRIVIKVVE